VISKADPNDSERDEKVFRQRSPRGLIENVGKVREWDSRTQSPEELSFLLREINAQGNPFTDIIRFWRRSASAIIEASGKNPDEYLGLAKRETLDHVCLAARVLKQLDKIETYIRIVERDPKQFHGAVREALFLSVLAHHLTVVDNETSIWTGEVHLRKLRENAANKRNEGDENRRRYQSRADEIWMRHPDWGKTRVATTIERELRARVENTKEKIAKADWIRRVICPTSAPLRRI
jgi:hypothetical protein